MNGDHKQHDKRESRHTEAPLVSVCMVTYNHAPFIAEAIEGVLMQKTPFPFELVIGEDHSTDETRSICIQYAAKYPNIVRLLPSERNIGMNRNAIRTLDACSGEYIALCEGDDYWIDSDKLWTQYDILTNHPEAIGICHDSWIEDVENQSTEIGIGKRVVDLRPDLRSLIREKSFRTASMFFRDLGDWRNTPEWFLEAQKLDYALALLLALNGSWLYLDKPMSVYRMHSGGVWTGRSKRDQLISNQLFFEQLYRDPAFENTQDAIRRRLVLNRMGLAIVDAQEGRFARAALIFFRAWLARPAHRRRLMLKKFIRTILVELRGSISKVWLRTPEYESASQIDPRTQNSRDNRRTGMVPIRTAGQIIRSKLHLRITNVSGGRGRSLSRTDKVVHAVATSNIVRALTVVIGFVITPIILGYLGRELYGFWIIIGSVLGYLGLVDLGIQGSVATLIARVQKDDSGTEISKIASNSLCAHSVSAIMVILLGLIAAHYIPLILQVGATQHTVVGTALAISSLALGFGFPARTLKAILRGTQNIATLRIAEFGLTLLRTAVVLCLLARGLGLLALPIAALVTSILGIVIYYRLSRMRCPKLVLSTKTVTFAEIKSILSVSLWWFLGAIGAVLIYQTDNLLLGRFLGPAIVTTYALTYRLPSIAREQIYQLNYAVAPGMGDLLGRENIASVADAYLKLLRVTFFLSISAAVIIILFGAEFVTIWVGEENYGGMPLMIIFALTLVYLVLFQTSSIVMTSALYLKSLALSRWLEGLLNLMLSLILVERWGASGVAAATLCAGLITSGWFVPYRACRILRIDLSTMTKQVGIRVLLFICSISGVVLIPIVVPVFRQIHIIGQVSGIVICLTILGFIFLLPRRRILDSFKKVIENARVPVTE